MMILKTKALEPESKESLKSARTLWAILHI